MKTRSKAMHHFCHLHKAIRVWEPQKLAHTSSELVENTSVINIMYWILKAVARRRVDVAAAWNGVRCRSFVASSLPLVGRNVQPQMQIRTSGMHSTNINMHNAADCKTQLELICVQQYSKRHFAAHARWLIVLGQPLTAATSPI
jgi:hypothetical protein